MPPFRLVSGEHGVSEKYLLTDEEPHDDSLVAVWASERDPAAEYKRLME